MSRDLEEHLYELGPEYRDVVKRLRNSVEVQPTRRIWANDNAVRWQFMRPYLLVASVMVVSMLAVFLVPDPTSSYNSYWHANTSHSASHQPAAVTPRPQITPPREYMLAGQMSEAAISEMIRTQNPDGSWNNEFLTRRNAEALRYLESAEARIAYKKAVRNLRYKGSREYR